MTHIIAMIWDRRFMSGLFIGLIGYHCLAMARCRWLNRKRPLPDGAQRHHRVSQLWAGSLVVALVLLYLIAQGDQRATKAEECYHEFTDSIIGYAKISEENDRLSRDHRSLLTEHNNATVDWINKLIYPPPDIAALFPSDPRRQAWNLDLTRNYFIHIQKLTRGMAVIETQQSDLEQWRRDHPLNELQCGVVNG